jgi:DNA-binding GntR family transcriptional regulator
MAERQDSDALLADTLADAIREAIVNGQYDSGRHLVETELAKRFGVSRNAIREALAILGNEGLTVRKANRGVMVRHVSREEAIEISQVRMAIEGICAARAAERCSDKDRDELMALGASQTVAVKQGDIMDYDRHSRLIHQRILDISGQRVAIDTLTRLRNRGIRYQFNLVLLPGRPKIGLKEHLEIIDAIVAGDAKGAESSMRQHLTGAAEAIMQLPDTLFPSPFI